MSSANRRAALHCISPLWPAKIYNQNQTASLPRNISHLDCLPSLIFSDLLLCASMGISNQNFRWFLIFSSYTKVFPSLTIFGHTFSVFYSSLSPSLPQSHILTISNITMTSFTTPSPRLSKTLLRYFMNTITLIVHELKGLPCVKNRTCWTIILNSLSDS